MSGKLVITKDQAFSILNETSMYMGTAEDYVGGKHRAEILAEAMIREGLTDLAQTTMQVHDTIKDFHKGKYQSMAFLAESPVFESFEQEAANTKFEKAVNAITKQLKSTNEIMAKMDDSEERIDWKASGEVIKATKKEHYPESLSMVERLDDWSQVQAKGQGVGRK